MAHVLVVVHADNRTTGGKEQQGFKEGVGHHMEHGHGVGRRAQRHGHIAELRQGGIGHHALDVVLNCAEKAHKQRGNRADDHDDAQGGAAQFVNRRHARHHKQTGGNHGCRVNQRGNRRRAFHRVGQPHVQRELGGFTHRADKQQQAGYGNQRPLHARNQLDGGVLHLRQIGEHVGVAQAAAEISQHQRDAQHKAEVADAVDQKRFQIGKSGRRFFEIETDQQIRHQAHRFPAEEKLDEVVGHNQHQHAECKQGDIAEKALVADCFVVHIADGVDMHHQRHAGDHRHHHRRHRIDQKADREINAAHCQPGIDVFVKLGARAVDKAPKHPAGQHGRHRHAEYCYRMRPRAADFIAEQPRQQRARQRQKGDGEV